MKRPRARPGTPLAVPCQDYDRLLTAMLEEGLIERHHHPDGHTTYHLTPPGAWLHDEFARNGKVVM